MLRSQEKVLRKTFTQTWRCSFNLLVN